MFVRLALATAAVACATTVQAGENEAVRFAIFRGYTAAIEDACPAYFAYGDATSGKELSPADRAAAMAIVPAWRKEMRRNVRSLGCDAAARDALAFTDLDFQQVWEFKE